LTAQDKPQTDPTDDGELETLLDALGHRARNPSLFLEALTHPSAKGLPDASRDSYERLEFLGDRVLGLVIADLLLSAFPEEPEGFLARRLATLVRRETLAEVGLELELGSFVRLAKGEQDSGEARNPAILADACEALIAALYLDGGLPAAHSFIARYWSGRLAAEPEPPKDAKTRLQEWAQGRGLALPAYRETSREGPPHEPLFSVEVRVEGLPPESGAGRSKRIAEQEAASRLLERIEEARGQR
jgi:ribonuclease-3